MTKIKFLFLLLLLPVCLIAQISDEELLRAIRHDETTKISNFLKNKANNPNSLYGPQKVPLLHYAASIDKAVAMQLLIDAGADVNKLYNNDSPLMIAVYFGNKNAAELLLKKGANADLKNSDGRTAAMDAARYNKTNMLKLLHQYRADITLKDNTGKSSIDYAYHLQNIESYSYLCSIAVCDYEKKPFSDYYDGPYVFWMGKSKIKVTYLINDSIANYTLRNDSILDIKKTDITLKNNHQPFDIPIREIKKNKADPSHFSNIEKIMAIGDLHGEFDEFAKFLKNNKIIDGNFHWTFGKGHLVLAGDIFDRGYKVNECFWLLYKLEEEAKKAGGYVHFVLGNHEIMQISGDKRYLGTKYLALFNRLKLNYTDFYGPDTELGRWLRTKNTIIKINDVIFVHGGLSTELINNDLNIEAINNLVRDIIKRNKPEANTQIEEFVLGNSGPLWYRGYLKLDSNYYKSTGEKYDMNEQTVDKILKYYNASAIVFANTHVKEISPLFNYKIFGIDIPFAESDAEFQGLFIEDNHFYKVHMNGEKILLK